MRPVECVNKHFYDADKYAECPHCAEMRLNGTMPLQPQEQVEKKPGFFDRLSKKKKKEAAVPLQVVSQTPPAAFTPPFPSGQTVPQADTEHTMALFSDQEAPSPFPADDVGQTMVLFADEPPQETTGFDDEHTMMLFPDAPQDDAGFDDEHTMMMFPDLSPEDDVDAIHIPAAAQVNESVQTAQTVGAPLNQTDMRTVSFYNFAAVGDPVVGWLVCLSGAHMGEFFALRSGRNNIGRAETMDVSLQNELSVSRDRHAILTYEPIRRQFILQAGESNGLTYLNQELVVTFKELHDRDKLQLGQADFIFVALCGENFSWEEYL